MSLPLARFGLAGWLFSALAMALLVSPRAAPAQFRSNAPAAALNAPQVAEEFVGRTFWTSPWHPQLQSIKFRHDAARLDTFEVTEDLQFTVLGVVDDSGPHYAPSEWNVWLHVQFADAGQTIGYLQLRDAVRHSTAPAPGMAQYASTANMSEEGSPFRRLQRDAVRAQKQRDAIPQAIVDQVEASRKAKR